MLVRYFYFSEALAIYELYYRPIVATSTKAQQELTDPDRQEDRPPTWVPLVFYCTTADRMGSIISDGMLKLNAGGYAWRHEPIRQGRAVLFQFIVIPRDLLCQPFNAAPRA
jgi:hypothetical protein